jgi:broad specificity phosphatase PhoE
MQENPTDSATTLFLVRHGQVHNPQAIIYGRLPGFGLSAQGREQLEKAAAQLQSQGPFAALFASPLQRAQESATILAGRLGLQVLTDERLVETNIGSFQGKKFADLPRPYIAEEGAHPEIESAASMRRRFLGWARQVHAQFTGQKVIAVSHRDPIIVALLHWMERPLSELPGFALEPGAVYQVRLGRGQSAVKALD